MIRATFSLALLFSLCLTAACNEASRSEPRPTDADAGAELDVVDAGDTALAADTEPDGPTACDDDPDIWPEALEPCDCPSTGFTRYIEFYDDDGQYLGTCLMEANCSTGPPGTVWFIYDWCESDPWHEAE